VSQFESDQPNPYASPQGGAAGETPPYLQGPEKPKSRSGLWLLFGAGAVLGMCCICGGILGYFASTGEVENIQSSVATPGQVELGETFDMVVEVTNTANEPQEFVDLDIDLTLLEGFRVVSVDPQPSGDETVLGMRTMAMNLDLPPSQPVAVTVSLEATAVGTFAGDVDVCINNQWAYVAHPQHIVVAAPGGANGAPATSEPIEVPDDFDVPLPPSGDPTEPPTDSASPEP